MKTKSVQIPVWLLVVLALGAALAAYVTYTSIRGIKAKTCEINRAYRTADSLKQQVKFLTDSILRLNDTLFDAQTFMLRYDAGGLGYLEQFYSDTVDWPKHIKSRLLQTNETEGNNPLVPYEGIEGPFKIKNVRVLNHKWIIADFTDGTYWGQLLLEYEPGPGDTVQFHVIRSFIYPAEKASF